MAKVRTIESNKALAKRIKKQAAKKEFDEKLDNKSKENKTKNVDEKPVKTEQTKETKSEKVESKAIHFTKLPENKNDSEKSGGQNAKQNFHFGRRLKRTVIQKILIGVSCFCLGMAAVFAFAFFEEKSVEEAFSAAPVFERGSIVETSSQFKEKVIARPEKMPEYGAVFGRVDIDSQNIHLDLRVGSDIDNLKTGTAMYSGSVFPGERGVSLIAGHARLDQLGRMTKMKEGETISVSTAWGTYVYRIDKMTVENAEKYPIDEKLADKSGWKAIFYTCYPIDVLGPTDRMFVETTLISGPVFEDSVILPDSVSK